MTNMTNWKNVNNWHWTEKNCTSWAQDYFKRVLTGLTVKEGPLSCHVDTISSVSGDVDLNQRKGKVLTLYDLDMKLNWAGEDANGTKVTGQIHIPEIAHDTDPEDYVFDISVDNEKSESYEIKQLVRKKLTLLVKERLLSFAKDLIETHLKDVYVMSSEADSTQVVKSDPMKTKPVICNPVTIATSPLKVNPISTTTLSIDTEFVASAHDIYDVLMSEQKMSMWSRERATMNAVEGGEFSLYGGNVTGTVVSLIPDKEIVLKWRLKSWSAGHFSTVTMTLNEQKESVMLALKQEGVPLSEKDPTTSNWHNYYFNPIKALFGYGAFMNV